MGRGVGLPVRYILHIYIIYMVQTHYPYYQKPFPTPQGGNLYTLHIHYIYTTCTLHIHYIYTTYTLYPVYTVYLLYSIYTIQYYLYVVYLELFFLYIYTYFLYTIYTIYNICIWYIIYIFMYIHYMYYIYYVYKYIYIYIYILLLYTHWNYTHYIHYHNTKPPPTTGGGEPFTTIPQGDGGGTSRRCTIYTISWSSSDDFPGPRPMNCCCRSPWKRNGGFQGPGSGWHRQKGRAWHVARGQISLCVIWLKKKRLKLAKQIKLNLR